MRCEAAGPPMSWAGGCGKIGAFLRGGRKVRIQPFARRSRNGALYAYAITITRSTPLMHLSLSHHNRKSTGCVTLDPKVENLGWALHCSTMWNIWHLCHYIALRLLKTLSNFEEQDVAIILLDALRMQRNSGP